MNLIQNQVEAYANHGRWIADCCRQYCQSALELRRGQQFFTCGECKQEASVVWPNNVDEITEVLKVRPVPSTRNWFPAGHDLAVRSGCEHGQSVQQLKDEQMEMESR